MENKQQPNSGTAPEATRDVSKDDGSARARLMEAATTLFAEHGLEGTSTRDIAKAADLNISLISYYFGGKEGLYKTVIEEFATRMYKESQQVMEGWDSENLTRESFAKTMRVMVDRMLPMKYENQKIHILLQREMMAGLPHAKDVYENVFSVVLEKIVGLYKQGQNKGIVRQDINPYIVFFSMVHATDMYLHMNSCHTKVEDKLYKLPEDLKKYCDQMYMIFVEGVMT